MTARKPPVSILATSVRAKDASRDRLQSDVEAWLRKRGNRIEVLDGPTPPRPELDYRELSWKLNTIDRERKTRRRAHKDIT